LDSPVGLEGGASPIRYVLYSKSGSFSPTCVYARVCIACVSQRRSQKAVTGAGCRVRVGSVS
jgi:hypothetical protein